MKKGFLILTCFLLASCFKSESPENIDVDREFERLYSSLEVENALDAILSKDVLFVDGSSTYFTEPEKADAATERQKVRAKEAFKKTILMKLSPKELKAAADFYSTTDGIAAHKAIIDAENSVSQILDQCLRDITRQLCVGRLKLGWLSFFANFSQVVRPQFT